MKTITKLIAALMLVGLVTYLVPSCAQAELKFRLDGFGEGEHPSLMVHSPFAVGPLDLAVGFAPERWLDESGSVQSGDYIPKMDVTLSKLDMSDSGYFTRVGLDFENWNPTVALGVTYAAADWAGGQLSYEWGYFNVSDELALQEGFQGRVLIGFYGKY